jgi:phage regulator Rha-like protein
MPKANTLAPIERIQSRILLIRGHRVMLDADLADVYGTTTKALNQAVKRNADRFPDDFMFQLTAEEMDSLRSHSVTSNPGRGGRRFRPYAFTEHGAIMLASVLNSAIAVQASIAVVRAFIRLREILATHQELAAKLDELEKRIEGHDEEITNLFDAIRLLMEPPETPDKNIGFHARPTLPEPEE